MTGSLPGAPRSQRKRQSRVAVLQPSQSPAVCRRQPQVAAMKSTPPMTATDAADAGMPLRVTSAVTAPRNCQGRS
jgi:hypothetical protein